MWEQNHFFFLLSQTIKILKTTYRPIESAKLTEGLALVGFQTQRKRQQKFASSKDSDLRESTTINI